MRCDVVAVGTELLLGQIVDTNSAWIGEHLALAGIDSHLQVKVGDNLERIVAAVRATLAQADAVIMCGGLGPTQDDITREAIAEVMGVELVRDDAVLARIEAVFAARALGRGPMSANNARQADVPVGATVIEQRRGTAPGLICPVGDKVIYAVPGVPDEMKEMLERAILPDLRARAGTRSVILSRVLRTWGLPESTLAERLAGRIEALDQEGNPTIAFLASGIEGIKVRLTAKAGDTAAAGALLDAEEAQVRALLGALVFGVDDETMEHAVGASVAAAGWRMAVAESLTGGLVAERLTRVPGASSWFRGGVVAYDPEVKFSLLGVPRGLVVSSDAAAAMASGVRRALAADVGIGVTGVAGPDESEGQPVGTVWWGIDLDGSVTTGSLALGRRERQRVREFATINVLDAVRRQLLDLATRS